MIYSPWTNGFSGTSTDWTVPALTQAVLDSSAVLVYFQFGNYVYQLPYNPGGFYVNDILGLGIIELMCSSPSDLSQFSFRYVIIPPGVAGTSVPRSYEEMTGRLGIAP